ncbi:MAG: hypothetical protein G8345_13890 [Magnetococcales bacterium]|nr:hypothetical protein [Magnetococcales bacterium]NGZ27967.1 hypothetical protein [Magnetococcales bacterium]
MFSNRSLGRNTKKLSKSVRDSVLESKVATARSYMLGEVGSAAFSQSWSFSSQSLPNKLGKEAASANPSQSIENVDDLFRDEILEKAGFFKEVDLALQSLSRRS